MVSLLGVEVKNNPAQFDAPYEFEITFECLEQLQKGEFNGMIARPGSNYGNQTSSGS